MTYEDLAAFSQAWTDKDLDRLMSFIDPDCIYGASVGPEPGQSFRGIKDVRRGFAQMLAHDTGQRRDGKVTIFGEVAIAEWSFIERHGDRTIETRGCDIFEFRGDKIVRKDAFRKVLS